MATIVAGVATGLVHRLRLLVSDPWLKNFGEMSEVKALQAKLEKILGALDDSERIIFEQPAAALGWVPALRDVVYKIDDFADGLSAMAQRERLSQPTEQSLLSLVGALSKVLLFDTNNHLEVVVELKQLNALLDEISNAILKAGHSLHLEAVDRVRLRQTTSNTFLATDLVFVGAQIHEDTREMVKLLVGTHEVRNPVFAITGMGGIGKTTLAQSVYNDSEVMYHFQIRLWISVSQKYDDIALLKAAVRYAGEMSDGEASKQTMEEILSSLVRDKRFLLVLDDVWSPAVWSGLLQKPLRSGDVGSRILLTTRDKEVARQMGAVHMPDVEPLSDKDSRSLLSKMVSLRKDEAAAAELLREVGDEIVKQCHGVPLAIEEIGGALLSEERSPSEVLKNWSWSLSGVRNETMSALYLSYEALPSHLKPCFLYCSLFPQSSVMARRDLVRLWIAEGLVEDNPNVAAEDLAEKYLEEIVSKNLLQIEPKEKEGSCKMHDLVRSFALLLAKDEVYAGKVEDLQFDTKTLRRLSIVGTNGHIVSECRSLRALLILKNQHIKELVLDELRCLRVLDLQGTNIEKITNCIGEMIHLRYLNLSGTAICELPSSIKDLWFLQFLSLNSCKNLNQMPQEISELRNLKSLDVLDTKIDKVPSGIHRMEQLNSLLGFVLASGEESQSSLEELRALTLLRDLHIVKLENATVGNGAYLENKTHLKSLVLSCTYKDDEYHISSRNIEIEKVFSIHQVFESLCPPSSLEQLIIDGFFSSRFPKWLLNVPKDSYPKLTRLELIKCAFCQELPPLGQLPQLRFLRISGLTKVTTITEKFYGEGSAPFVGLEMLVIEEMSNLETWLEPIIGAFPCLKTLELQYCPQLRDLPKWLQSSTTLVTLYIDSAYSLRSILGLTNIEELHIQNCPNLEQVSNLLKLKNLKINKCSELQDLEGVPCLQHLEITDFAMESLPEWLSKLETLKKLEITTNNDVLRKLEVRGEYWHKVAHIAQIIAHK